MINIRRMEPSESPLFVEWLYQNRKLNHFDPEIFKRGQADVYVAEDETGILYFLPVRILWMFDSVAPRPGLGADMAKDCLRAFQQEFVQKADSANVSEIVFRASEPSMPNFAETQGWVESPDMWSLNINAIGNRRA